MGSMCLAAGFSNMTVTVTRVQGFSPLQQDSMTMVVVTVQGFGPLQARFGDGDR